MAQKQNIITNRKKKYKLEVMVYGDICIKAFSDVAAVESIRKGVHNNKILWDEIKVLSIERIKR